jgi:hypothetical protein
MPDNGAVENFIKLIAEGLFVGGSELVDGNIKVGLGHTLLGLAVGAFAGPVGMLLVKANSYSHSVSKKHLHQHIRELFSSGQPDAARSPATGS